MRKLIQIYVIGCLILTASFANANSIESSTMHFEGVLEDFGDGVYVGTIPMTAGEYYVSGGGGQLIYDQGGFDVYAEQGACALVEGYYGTGEWNCNGEDTYTIGYFNESPNDAYATPGGPWDSWFDPDVADWENYELVLTAPTDSSAAHWYLRYNGGILGEGNATPMSGVMDWENMYAYEDDIGAYVSPPSDIDGGAANFGAGAGYWDMDWTWGSEAIPLAFPGFLIEIIPDNEGKYHVILTPGESPDDETEGDQLVDELCSPDGDWKNHGEYVSCVAHAAAELFAQGLFSEEKIGEIISEAARSDVGKKNKSNKGKKSKNDSDSDSDSDSDKKEKKPKKGKKPKKK